jgi:hypothetical protein
MFILIVALLGVSNPPLDHMEFSSKESCEDARMSIKNSIQMRNKNVFAECVQK